MIKRFVTRLGESADGRLRAVYERWFTRILISVYKRQFHWGPTARAIQTAKLAVLRSSFKSCGDRLGVQFPVTIVQPEEISLGDDVRLAAYVHIWGGGGVSIGDRVLVGALTSITSLTHDYDQHPMFDTLVCKPVVIEDDVWMGSNCVVMPGVRIGCGAVIGAGSVVTRDIAPWGIAFGVPASVKKYRTMANINEPGEQP